VGGQSERWRPSAELCPDRTEEAPCLHCIRSHRQIAEKSQGLLVVACGAFPVKLRQIISWRNGQYWDTIAEGLLSYAVTEMTNGRMEGINRKIKTLLRQVYGFRDDDFLRLKLYALHESKHKLLG
jgi:hypothetical protein